MKVKDKVFVVTGGGSGVGRALALELLSRGARVAISDINEAGMDETRSMAGEWESHLSTHLINVANREKVQTFPEEVIGVHGAVDGIINNAGIIQPFIKVLDLDYSSMERIMNVNFYGSLYMVKSFLPHLLQRPEGHIVNVSSMGGFLPVPGQTIYGASKAALKLLTEGLRSELLDTGVRVSLVLPGAMSTNIMANSGLADREDPESEKMAQKILTPQEAARLIINGTEKNRARIILGTDSRMMDFLTRLNPTFAAGLIARKMKDLITAGEEDTNKEERSATAA